MLRISLSQQIAPAVSRNLEPIVADQCPLHPESRQNSRHLCRSALCHKRTYEVQEKPRYSITWSARNSRSQVVVYVIHLNNWVSDRRLSMLMANSIITAS